MPGARELDVCAASGSSDFGWLGQKFSATPTKRRDRASVPRWDCGRYAIYGSLTAATWPRSDPECSRHRSSLEERCSIKSLSPPQVTALEAAGLLSSPARRPKLLRATPSGTPARTVRRRTLER